MSQKEPLAVPLFVKLRDLEKVGSGYNVYVKVISFEQKQVDTRDGQKIPMVNCVVADETASATAFFKGDNAKLIKKDNVIAIRNGLKRFIKNLISLQVDLFGRVTLEKAVTINVAADSYNISTVEHKLSDKPRANYRRDNRDGRPTGGRREGGDRRDNRDDRGNRDNRRERREDRNYRNQRPRNTEDRDYDKKPQTSEKIEKKETARPAEQVHEKTVEANNKGNESGQVRNNDRNNDRNYDRNNTRNYDRNNNRTYDRNNNDRTYDRNNNDRRNNNRDYDRNNNPDYNRNNNRGYDRNNNRGYDRNDNRDYDRKDNRDYDNTRNYDRRQNQYNRGDDRRDNRRYERTQNDRDIDRDYDRQQNPHRDQPRQVKQFQQKGENREQRTPLQWTTIKDISPGDIKLNLIAQVISVEKVGRNTRVTLGDNTGLSKAFLPDSQDIVVGESIALFNARAEVVKEHIEIQLARSGSRVQKSRRQVSSVNEAFNLSDKAWVPVD